MAFVERYRNILGKVHITRILGTNKAGDILPDIWADVERVENFTVATQLAGQYQETVYKFRWRDDPDEEYYRAEDDRSEDENLTSTETIILKVCSPDESDLNDPGEWIPVRVIKRLRMLKGGEGGMTSKNFLSDQLTKDLGVRLRRIYHYDTSMDDKAGAKFNADPTRKAYVEKAYLYAKDDETKDDGQYIECEIVTHILKYENNAHESSNGADQKVYVNFKNQYLIDESEPARLEELGNQDKNPPYRLDPFQNIVNVHFKTIYLVVVVTVSNQSSSHGPYPAPDVTTPSASAAGSDVSGIKLLDTYLPPAANNVSSGYSGCFNYLANPTSGPGLTPQQAWALFPGRTYPPTNGVCVLSPPSAAEDGFAVSPANYFRTNETTIEYLYSVPAGTELVTVKAKDIMPFYDSGFDSSLNTQTTSFGNASIYAAVYSRVKGSVTKLSQLIDYNNDGKPRPTEDDSCTAGIAPYTGGTFQVNVALDKDPDHAQIDNYGKTFQPYKATITPGESTDSIPDQPPPSLIGVPPVPAKAG